MAEEKINEALFNAVLAPVQKKKKPRRLWDNYHDLFEVQKSDRLKIVVAAATRDGFRCLQIREFYFRKQDQTWRPGRDGIVVPILAPLRGQLNEDGKVKTIKPLEELLKVLPEAMNFASTMPLADPEHARWSTPKE